MQVYIARRRCRCCELISARLVPVDRPDIGASSTIYRSGGIFREEIREKRPNPDAPRPAAFGSRYIVPPTICVYVLCLIKKHKSRTDFTWIFLGCFLPRRASRTRSITVQCIRETNPHKLLSSVRDTRSLCSVWPDEYCWPSTRTSSALFLSFATLLSVAII